VNQTLCRTKRRKAPKEELTNKFVHITNFERREETKPILEYTVVSNLLDVTSETMYIEEVVIDGFKSYAHRTVIKG
jgi:hypothetical protein